MAGFLRAAAMIAIGCMLELAPAAVAAFTDAELNQKAHAIERDIRAYPEKAQAQLSELLPYARAGASQSTRYLVEGLHLEALDRAEREVYALRRGDELEREGRSEGDQGLVALALLTRSYNADYRSTASSYAIAKDAYGAAQKSGDLYVRYLAAILLAAEEAIQQRRTEARVLLSEALALAVSSESSSRRIHALIRLAALDHRLRSEESIQESQQAFDLAKEVGSVYGMSEAKRIQSAAFEKLNRPVEERATAEEAVRIAHEARSDSLETRALNLLIHVCRARNDYAATLQNARRHLELSEVRGDLSWIAQRKTDIGWALQGLGKAEEAEAFLHQGQALSERVKSRQLREDYDAEVHGRELELVNRDLALKAAEVENLALMQRVWWGVAFALLALLGFAGVLYRKRQIINRLTLERNAEAQERKLLEGRLKTLQAQIEPHFLYNTLANAQALISKNPADAGAMLTSLIRYLREALPKMREKASTLRQEFALAEAYLNIARIRFGGRLSFDVNLPDDLAATEFPPLIVQTLVENALKHGVEPKAGPAHIAIRASIDGGALVITVTDDGVGFGSKQGSGVGLRNTRERLKAVYGNGAKLELAPNEPAGVRATVVLRETGVRSG
jgi:hypothetical protein